MSSILGFANEQQLGRVKLSCRKLHTDAEECFLKAEHGNRSAIIDYLTRFTRSSPQRAAVAYAYCDYRMQESQTTLDLVACFLRQLLEFYWEVNVSVCLLMALLVCGRFALSCSRALSECVRS
jgi:hypothetical protein